MTEPKPCHPLASIGTGVFALHVLSNPHVYSCTLECFPGLMHGEQAVAPGSDEKPTGHGVMTELTQKLPWAHGLHSDAVVLAMYWPLGHVDWHIPLEIRREPSGQVHPVTLLVPAADASTVLVLEDATLTDQNTAVPKEAPAGNISWVVAPGVYGNDHT
jgi:hypothetical protein